jgi:hypothetical protein
MIGLTNVAAGANDLKCTNGFWVPYYQFAGGGCTIPMCPQPQPDASTSTGDGGDTGATDGAATDTSVDGAVPYVVGLNQTCSFDGHAPVAAGAEPDSTCASGLTCVRSSDQCVESHGGGSCQAVSCDQTSPVCDCGGVTYPDLCALSAVLGAVFYEGPCVTDRVPGDPSHWLLKAGTWGGDGIRVTLTENGGTVETGCGAGTIDEAPLVSTSALLLGIKYPFSWKGTFTRSGASSADSVTYAGGGQFPEIWIEIDEGDGGSPGGGTLQFGNPGTTGACQSTTIEDAAADARSGDAGSLDGGGGG